MTAVAEAGRIPRGIVIYGAGSVGRAVAVACRSRGWTVTGAVNRPGPKIGTPLAGDGPVIGATLDEALDGRTADIAVVAIGDDVSANLPVYRDCFAAGLSVICSGCEASFPQAVSAGIAETIDAEAKAAGVTFCGAGFQDIARIWTLRCLVAATGPVRSIRHVSRADAGRHGAQSLRLAGIGLTREEFEHMRLALRHGVSAYRVFVHHCAVAVGLTPAHVEQDILPLFNAPDAPLTRGTIFVTRLETEEGVTIAAENELGLLAPGETESFAWSAEGEAGAKITLSDIDTSRSTAIQITNRIPSVLAAPVGLISTDRLPFPFTAATRLS